MIQGQANWANVAVSALGTFASIFGKKSAPPVVQPKIYNPVPQPKSFLSLPVIMIGVAGILGIGSLIFLRGK